MSTIYQTAAGLITADEARVLAGIDRAYAYQPPAELIAAATALYERGLVEPCPGFPAVTQMTSAGWGAWQQVEAARYAAAEQREA